MSYGFSSSYRARQTQGGLSYVCTLRKNVRLIYLSSVLIFLGSSLSQKKKKWNISYSIPCTLALTVFFKQHTVAFLFLPLWPWGSFHSRCISRLTRDHFFNTKLATEKYLNLCFKLKRLLAGLIKDLFPKFEAELLVFPLGTIQHKFQTSRRPQWVCLTLGNISKIFPLKKHFYCCFSGSVAYSTIHAVCYFKGKMNF